MNMMTNEQFLERLAAVHPEITPNEQYKGLRKLINVSATCGHEWQATPRSLLQGKGCPICNTRMKSDEQFRKELYIANPTIIALEPYKGNHSKIRCRCEMCGYEYYAEPAGLLAGSGCIKCSQRNNGIRCRKSNATFLMELSERNPMIEALEAYKTAKDSILVRCKSCG